MADKEKRISLLCFSVFFGFCALFAAEKIKSYDVWWHLKTGEWIWAHKAIPQVDPFSYTFQGAEWIDFEWLFQAVIYPIYQLGGFGGLIIFKIVIVLLTFVFLFLICHEVDGGRGWLSVTLLFIVLLIARGRFMVRPDIVFLLFLALYSYILTLYRNEKITTTQLIVFLLPLHVLWVNFHGSFLIGIFLAGAFALGRFVPLATSHHRDLKPVFQDKKLRNLLFLCLLLCLVSLLNPHTYRALLFPLETAGSEEILRGISEWAPVDIRGLGLFIIDYTVWFRALFLLGVISFLISRKNLTRVEHVVIFALFSYMAFKHIRFLGAFAIATVPITVYNFSHLQWQLHGRRWLRFIPLVIIISFCVNEMGTLIRTGKLGLGAWKNYPQATVQFLKEHEVKGRIFNAYGFGGYIIWHLWPDIPVFIDGRTIALYDQDFFWLYGGMERKKELWDKATERYKIDIVLVHDIREIGYASFLQFLDNDDNWRLVAFDDFSNLYLKKGTKFDGLIKKYEFHHLMPSDLTMDYAKVKRGDTKYLKFLERELMDACRRSPRDFYPFYYLGVYHQIYGTEESLLDAEKAFRKAVANRPYFPRGHYELGFTLMKLNRYDEAAAAMKKSIRFSNRCPADVYYYLGVSLFHTGELGEAIKFLEKYKEKAGFETRIEAYSFLGRAYLQRHRLRKALSCFKREEYLGSPPWETYVNMGVAYIGLDNLEEAKESFERAMEMEPDRLKVVYNLAVVYEKLELRERAKELFGEASKMQPRTPEEEVWVQRAREKAK